MGMAVYWITEKTWRLQLLVLLMFFLKTFPVSEKFQSFKPTNNSKDEMIKNKIAVF